MNKLRDKYKFAVIPRGTLLFRRAPNILIHDSMYFSFDYYGSASTDYIDSPLQLWITINPIISTFIVDKKTSNNIYLTDLSYLYKEFCNEEKYHLDIKHRNNTKLKEFLFFLTKNNINSWVTSVENKAAMELHLFTTNNKQFIKFKQEINEYKNRILIRKNSFNSVILLDSSGNTYK